MLEGPRAIVAVFLAIALIAGFIWLLVSLTRRAEQDQPWSGWALLALGTLIFVGGIWIWPAWLLLVIVPVVGWYLMKPKTSEARWDEMSREGRSAPMTRDDEAKYLAKGRCPSCGAKNDPEADRCHVCGSLLEVL